MVEPLPNNTFIPPDSVPNMEMVVGLPLGDYDEGWMDRGAFTKHSSW